MKITTQKPDVIGICETWIQDDPLNEWFYPSECLQIEGYNLYRYDNPAAIRGGIILYIKAKYDGGVCKQMNATAKIFEESAWHWISIPASDSSNSPEKLLFGCIYRKGSSTSENNTNLNTVLEKACKLNDIVTICGDFNFPSIKWGIESDNLKAITSATATTFKDTMDDLFLTQHVSSATRKRGKDLPSTLDLVFTDYNQVINKPTVESPIKKSDHGVVAWKSTFKVSNNTNNTPMEPKFNYFKGHYKAMREDLTKIDWASKFKDCDTINDMTTKFEEIIGDLRGKHIPLKKVGKKSQCPWVNLKSIKAIKRKYHAWKRFQLTRSHNQYLQYVKERNRATKTLRKSRREFEKKIAKEASSNPKAFYQYVNSYKKKSTTFIRLKKKFTNQNNGTDQNNEELTESDLDTAEELNAFFKSVFTKDSDTAALNVNQFFRTFTDTEEIGEPFNLPYNLSNGNTSLTDFDFTKEDVLNLLRVINPNKSAGDDEIHPRLLKECANELAMPIYMLFKCSIDTGTVPDTWKSATITPLHKSDDRDIAENYRPISITSQMIKLLEKLVRSKLVNHLTANGIISKDQHGFCEKKSCMTNLLETLDYVTKMVDNGFQVDEIFLDFCKAFDKVSHERLLYKLHSMGIEDKALQWVSSFLTNRRQRVRVNGVYSSWADVTSGVPQGSVLGPILFVAFINDLPATIFSDCKLFADDSKIYGLASTPEDIQKIQDDLCKAYEWSKEWGMEFHPKKCKVLHFGKKNIEHKYLLGEHLVEPVNHEKDLGVVISDDLGWAEHIKTCVSKANRMIGIIRRTFSHINQDMFLVLYKTFIRPHLEYCPEVWNPYLVKDINSLEKVQRRATKLVSNLQDLPYEERLTKLKLFPLQDRRLRGDMITTFKLLNGLLDADKDNLVPLSKSTRDSRSHNQQIYCNIPRTNTRKYFFTNRIILPWNTLSQETISSDTVVTFKARYDKERLGGFI